MSGASIGECKQNCSNLLIAHDTWETKLKNVISQSESVYAANFLFPLIFNTKR